MPIKIMNLVTNCCFCFYKAYHGEKKTKKKKLSGWDRKKLHETAKREQESSKCRKLDGYLSFSTSMTSAAPEVEPSDDSLSTFSPEEGDSTQAVVVESEVEPSKDLLVDTFSGCTGGGSGALRKLGKTGALELLI